MEALFSDEYLDYWGREFVRYDLYRRRGIRFDTFVMMPKQILEAVFATPREAPLLPSRTLMMHLHRQVEIETLAKVGPPSGPSASGSTAKLRQLSHHIGVPA